MISRDDRLLGPLVAVIALAAGLLLPGLPGEIGIFVAAAVLPGLAAADWLVPQANTWTRTIAGMALGPLTASVLAIGPFMMGASTRALVVAVALSGALAHATAPARSRESGRGSPPHGLDTPPSRALLLLVLAMVAALAVPPLASEWGRVKGDGWIHAGIVHEILERGVPPEDPRWAGQTLNYVWVYNFFVALLSGANGGDPFTFMVLINLFDLAAFLGLVHVVAWTIWRERRIAALAVGLTFVGLNAGAWLLWPLRTLRGLAGSVRGPEAVQDALRAPDLLSWRVFYELSAPFAHMVSFIDKFTIGTALNQAWVHMMLVLWAVFAWTTGGPRALLVLVAAGTLGMLLFHGVVGLSVVPVLGLTLLAVLVGSLTGRMRESLPAGRIVVAGFALLAGTVAALPYTRAISRGWNPERSGLAHSYFVLSPIMGWTLLTACGIVLALAWVPARRLLRAGHGPGLLLVVFAGFMTAFALLVNLPEDNESKFAFQVFFAAAILAAPAIEPGFARLRARLGPILATGLVMVLFCIPPVLTLVGLTVERDGRAAPHANLGVTERRFHAWLTRATPRDAVVVDAGFRDYAMVLAARQLYCGASVGPSRAGFPASQVRERHAVMADLYGEAADLGGDAMKLERLGRPVFVVYRDADFDDPSRARVLDRLPERFHKLRDAEGFVVYSLIARPTPGGSR